MRLFSLSLIALLASFYLIPSPASAQATGLSDATLQQTERLIEQAQTSDFGYQYLEDLTTEIGPRLAGSPAEARARDWAIARLKSMGFKNVRVEPFDIPYWQRHFERAEIISPFPQQLAITALGGSVATPDEGVSGKVVRFETLEELQNAPLTGYEGKIIFVDEYMTRTQDGSGYGVAVRKRSGAANEAGKRGAVAALIRSVGTDHYRRPHTGQMRYEEGVKKVPIAALAAPDADQLQRALQRGSVEIWLGLDVESPGQHPSGNVIAEIPGRTDEIVIIGGHLDSWDLGTGAIDDGAGVAITTAAAKLILDSHRKPKRTIRLVYFGSEEVGLLGAKAYAEAHKDELDKHFVGSESDFGADKIYQFQTRFGKAALPLAEEMAQPLIKLGIAPGPNMASGGPDMSPLRQLGVPVVTLKQSGWDYFDLHHTADDTFDKVAPETMRQNIAAWSGFIWMAANIDGDLRTNE